MTTRRGSSATRWPVLVVAVLGTAAVAAVGGTALLRDEPARVPAPDPVLTDIAAESGLEVTNESWTATPVDYDGDGRQDVFVGYHDQGGQLFRAEPDDTYTPVAGETWPRLRKEVIDRHTCAWGDVDGDDRPDAYCAVGRTGANLVKDDSIDNELYLQTEPGEFTEVGTAWGVGDPCGRGRTPVLVDVDGDEDLDLFVANDLPRDGDDCSVDVDVLPARGENKLYLNENGEGFRPAPGFGLDEVTGNGSCAFAFDWNDDGFQDILLCGRERVHLYENQDGKGFEDVSTSAGLGAWAADGQLGDLDQDEDLDFLGVRSGAQGGSVFYLENRGNRFARPVEIREFPEPGPFRAALGDINGDDRLDVYVVMSDTDANPDDLVLVNEGLWRFSDMPVPSAGGSGSDAAALALPSGETAFLVLNGREVEGPVQLITLR